MMLKQRLKNNIKYPIIFITFILILSTLGCESDDSDFFIRKGRTIDPYVNSVIVATEESELDKYTPFLNGHIELNKGFEVQGWMIFDIPRSIKPLTIWWRESDDIVIDLPK